MNKRLNLPMSRLLQEVAKAHKIDISKNLLEDGTWVLSHEERESLRSALMLEMARTGFDKDYEPNKRGAMLEDLIDLLFNYRSK